MKLKYTLVDMVLMALGFRWLRGKKQTLFFRVAAALNLFSTQAQAQVGQDNGGWKEWAIVRHDKPLF
jgi:hypothetical protein